MYVYYSACSMAQFKRKEKYEMLKGMGLQNYGTHFSHVSEEHTHMTA